MNQLAYKSKVIQRKLPQNHNALDDFFYNRLEYKLPFMYLKNIKKVTITSIGVLYKHFYPIADLDLPLPKKLINKKQFYLKHLLVNHLKKKWISKTNNTYIIFANRNSENYYHWLLECIPRLYVMRNLIQDNVVLIPYFCNKAFHNEILEYFNIATIEVAQADSFYNFHSIITSNYPASSSSHNPELLLNLRLYFYEKIRFLDTPVSGEKIFISRKPNSKRCLVNHEDVENCLISYDFNIIYLEDYSFEEQVRLFYHAKQVVGIHGAGLSNLLFMKSGSILELRSSDQGEYGLCYYTLSDAVGLNYYYQLCKPTKPKDYMHTDLIVDIKILSRNLNLMLSVPFV